MPTHPPSNAVNGMALEKIVPGARVYGVSGTSVVEIVQTRWIGSNFLQVTFRHDDGRTAQAMLRREDEARLQLEVASGARAFDADPESWRLAAEALRIRYAALHDPMVAIGTSNLDPLPHQIRAVYDDLLPRTPLRFVLADDPGAGKTIMAGLYIKELILRSDLERCLVVAPGALVDQWQDELYDKFGLNFEILTKDRIDAARTPSDLFESHRLLIARMDQLARSEELRDGLGTSDWDLVVVDEAHRMSAHYFGNELKRTKRYDLGLLLGKVTRHLLLMTATPHSGKQDDFQLFLALLDADRFEGRYREGVHSIDPDDMMRRMVKEELLTMDGKPLFPERFAYTVPYELSAQESELYDVVTGYVREEMGRADRLDEGESRRRTNVGFALTVLQRRLASSPEAILKSLERRQQRLERRLREAGNDQVGADMPVAARLDLILGKAEENIDDHLEDLDGGQVEDLEEAVVDAATAARTREELRIEIGVLSGLIEVARRVRRSGTDRKWSELRTILCDHEIVADQHGLPRKIIVFTEHRDTLTYLVEQIGELLNDSGAVVSIHGGIAREQRRVAQEQFSSDPRIRVLVATDAAGEGLNLQRAHLMVNYDLPWNPNKIEQRFGRIHRIGQQEVCHLWNLVASNTREGDVFMRLLDKVEQQRNALGGRVFDVLGDAFDEHPLRELLIAAIRRGDDPAVRSHLETVLDSTVQDGIEQLLAERALHVTRMGDDEAAAIRTEFDKAKAYRLQPHYVRSFFLAAFQKLGGRIVKREDARFEILNVPALVRERDRQSGEGPVVLPRYERVCFDRDSVHIHGYPAAQLLAPGHPLVDAVVEMTIADNAAVLKHGTVLVDPQDASTTPRLLVASTDQIVDGHTPARTLAKRFSFTEISPDRSANEAGPSPYLDYEPLPDDADWAVNDVMNGDWLANGIEEFAVDWAVENTLDQYISAVSKSVTDRVDRTKQAVCDRLMSEISRWDAEHSRLLDQQGAGRKLRISPEYAHRRARDLETRLALRMTELEADEALTVEPPVIQGSALIIPAGMLGQADQRHARAAGARAAALSAAHDAERQTGADPTESREAKLGFDIRSVRRDGSVVQIGVKLPPKNGDTLFIGKNEVIMAKNVGADYRLALVAPSNNKPDSYTVRYVRGPYDDVNPDDFDATNFGLSWNGLWERGELSQ